MSNERPSSGSWQHLESAWQAETGPEAKHNEAPATAVAKPGKHTEATDQLYRQIVGLGQRQQRLGLLVMVCELLVVLIFGTQAILWLVNGSPALRIAGVFVLTILLVVSLLRRRAWLDRRSVPEAPPRHFVQALLTKNAAGFRAITLAKRLLAVQVLFFLIWLPLQQPAPEALWRGYAFLTLWTAAFLLALLAIRNDLDRERRRIEHLKSELFDSPAGA